MSDTGKLSKDEVHYRPAPGSRCCASCGKFMPSAAAAVIRTGNCIDVAGQVDAVHLCDRWGQLVEALPGQAEGPKLLPG